MKRKILLTFILAATLIALFAISVSAAEPVETWDVSATENDNVTAYLYKDVENEDMYTITISGNGNMKLPSWTAPWYSSYASRIVSVTINEGVTNVADRAFSSCSHLETVEIPNGVTEIGYNAFNGCSNLKNVKIPIGVISIGSSAFRLCSKLASVEIPESVTSIGLQAFFFCSSLTSITIPKNVTSMESSVFGFCSKLTIYCEAESLPKGWSLDWNDDCPVVWGHIHTYTDGICVCGKERTYVEKWDVSKNADGSVMAYLYNDPNRSGYYTLTISGTGEMKSWVSYSSVPWYSSYSFQITSVTIENGVTTIGAEAFCECYSLESVVIGDSVTSIGAYAFYYCSGLTSVVIPDSVTTIGDGAFSCCFSLTSVVIGDSVTTIGVEAFRNGDRLTSVVIPDSVTTIGDYAFGYCDRLTSVVIPDSVTTIGASAFYYCPSLTIYCEAESQPSGWNGRWNPSNRPVVWGHSHSYDSTTDLCVCGAKANYVETWDVSKNADGSVMAYLYNDPNRSGYYTLTISGTGEMKSWVSYSSVPWYSSYSFQITSVTIENGVTTIGAEAFCECYSLESVVIGDSVTSIGAYAFYYCSGLTSVVIPDSVTTIGDGAFSCCFSLTSVVIGDSVTTIGVEAFRNGDRLTSVVIPDSVTTIGDYAFGYCDRLTSVVIPDSVTTIGASAFYYCPSLTIYCEAENKLSGWDSEWNYSNCPVVWGHTHTYENYQCVCGMVSYDELLEKVFTFKGYSFNEAGSIAVGFDIDYEAIALYEELTGEKLEIGVVFAGYELLNGQNPLDNQGNAIALASGKVIKSDLSNYSYTTYDFMLTDVTDAIKDIPLVIAAYINNGQETKYVQSNGISDTVSGITYNEAKENN